MIAKISKGGSFRGALDYVLGKEKAELIGGNMSGETARELSSEYGRIRQIKEDIEKPVYHVSLALPEGESFTPEQWQVVAGDYLSQMGLDPSKYQYIVAQHQDTKHQHIHIIANRIALDGELFNVFRDQIKSKDVCRKLEAKYGLTEVSNEKKTYRAKTTQKERQMNKRTGRDSEKVYIQEKLNLLLQDEVTFTPQELSRALEDNGIILIPNVASTGKINGCSFQYAGRNYTGSQVGYAWKYLEPHLTMDSESVSWMQEQRQKLQEGTPSDAVRSIRNAVWEVGIQGMPFDKALEKQGWTLEGNQLKKGAVEYSLSSIVDTDTLYANLKTLEGFSKETKAKAQAKSRELARHYHAPRRKSFMAEMRTEDVICGLMMFPEVAVFLVVLSVLTETIRRLEKPRNEVEFRDRMKEIWEQSNAEVREEVKRVQEGIRNAGIARRDKTDKSVIKDTGRELGKEGGGREPSVREVGETPHIAAFRGEGRDRGNEGSERVLAVEKTYIDNDGIAGVPRGSGAAAVESLSARSEQRDVQANLDVGAVAEWASLAEDLSILARGEEDMTKEKEKPSHVRRREEAWAQQHAALQAKHYRITIRGRGDRDGKTINLGKDQGPAVSSLEEAITLYRNMNLGYTEQEIKETYRNAKINDNGTRNMEKFWTAEEVEKQIPRLEYFNATGNDIYLTPIDAGTHFVLLDDLTKKGVEHVKASGYDPCIICSSSENNYQAVLRVPRSQISEEEQACGTALMQRLNQRLPDGCGGDKAITAVRHAFRMTGFHNKKPGRGNIQTVIQETHPGIMCQKATAELGEVRIEREMTRTVERKTAVRREAKERMRHIDSTRDRSIPRPEGETACEKDFRFRWNRIHGLAKKNVREGIWKDIDDSVIDYRVVVEMFQQGYAEDETAAAMYRCSPNLHVRHVDPDDYVRRTVSKAAGAVRSGVAMAAAGIDSDMRLY